MPAVKPAFNRGAKVTIKGRPGTYQILDALTIGRPDIVNGRFKLVDTVFYKFDDQPDYLWAYEPDLKPVKVK